MEALADAVRVRSREAAATEVLGSMEMIGEGAVLQEQIVFDPTTGAVQGQRNRTDLRSRRRGRGTFRGAEFRAFGRARARTRPGQGRAPRSREGRKGRERRELSSARAFPMAFASRSHTETAILFAAGLLGLGAAGTAARLARTDVPLATMYGLGQGPEGEQDEDEEQGPHDADYPTRSEIRGGRLSSIAVHATHGTWRSRRGSESACGGSR